MTSNALQDGPRPGGYSPVRVRRFTPTSGPSGIALFALGAGIMGWGFYRVGQHNIHQRALKIEKTSMRANLIPLLQAEEDSKFAAAAVASRQEEAKLMSKVDGWKVGESPYHSKRWVPPTNGI